MQFNRLIPEFAVRSLERSLNFYVQLLGFKVEYDRPEEGFAFLSLGDAQLMLDQIDLGRTLGDGLEDKELGAGLNVQIGVSQASLRAMASQLEHEGIALHLPLEERWYRMDDREIGSHQFAVADPDGYLLRFASDLGERVL